MKRRVVIGLLGLVIVGLAVWRLYDPGWRYDIKGVDVAHHQGSIDWDALADGTSFAYIKATEGGDWTDPRFQENWDEAGEAGVLHGAYHFFTLCTAGSEQASNMIATVPDEIGMLPPAIDLEFAGNCSARPAVADFRLELDAFIREIEDHYRLKPVIYTNAHFYGEYLDQDPPDVIWWIQTPILEPWGAPEWTFWQHLPDHKPGVAGDIDSNVFRGTLAELMQLTERH